MVSTLGLIATKFLENVQTTQYISANCRTIIDKMTITNTTGSIVTLSANLVPSGGSAGSSNLVISARSIAPGETYSCPELVGHVLNANDFISMIAGTASALSIKASGRQVT